MADAAPERSPTRLLSHYKAVRDPDGHLVLMMPWPGSPLLGCALPAVIMSLVGGVLAIFGHSPVAYGIPVIALLFAAIVILTLIYQSSHAWVLSRGQIRRATTFRSRYWTGSRWLGARSVVLKRAFWPSGRGSTDRVFVVTDRASPLNVLSVYNWDGQESRLASGRTRSLARSGPLVPDAAKPMATTADETLRASASEAVREMTDLLLHELGVQLSFECEKLAPPPRRGRPGGRG
jgi:hypothetical protein